MSNCSLGACFSTVLVEVPVAWLGGCFSTVLDEMPVAWWGVCGMVSLLLGLSAFASSFVAVLPGIALPLCGATVTTVLASVLRGICATDIGILVGGCSEYPSS